MKKVLSILSFFLSIYGIFAMEDKNNVIANKQQSDTESGFTESTRVNLKEESYSFSLAKKDQDLSDYKSIYLQAYSYLLQNVLNEEQLNERFDSMQTLIGNEETFYIVLFEHEKQPIGSAPFFKKKINDTSSAIFYDTSLKGGYYDAIRAILPHFINLHSLKKGYWFADNHASRIKQTMNTQDWEEDDKAPFECDNRIKWNPTEYTKYSKDFTTTSFTTEN